MKLLIGNHNYSTWSMRPWLFVHYHELPVEVICMELFSDDLLQTLEPHFSDGKVPLLLDGKFEVWDSIAIMEYLGERFPESASWPTNREARAVARAVSAEMHSSFSVLREEAPMNIRKRFPGYELSKQALKEVSRIQNIWRHCRNNYGANGPWLFGDFSIADAMYAPVVMRFRSVQVDLDETSQNYCNTINQCESVIRWIDQAYQEQGVVDADEIDWPGESIPPRSV
ncbi:MAG: glutathione S-transferase [Arenicellales bacterium]